MDNISTNIYDYDIDDLLQIFYLDNNPSKQQINDAANNAINIVKNDPTLIQFLQQAKQTLLNNFGFGYSNNTNITNNIDTGIKNTENSTLNNWTQNEYIPQQNNSQYQKITNRKNQVQTWNDNTHYQMKQTQLGVNNNYQVPEVQDMLNPTLRNLNSTIINLDSQFRNNILPYEPLNPDSTSSSTNYTIDLTEPLNNILSLKLYSVQIPYTWYAFSENNSNLCLFAEYNNTKYFFKLPAGNYSYTELKEQLNLQANWTPDLPVVWDYNNNNGKYSFTLLSGTIIFYFYDIAGNYTCPNNSCVSNAQLNQNLGWSLGFRSQLENGISSATFTADSSTTFTLPAVPDINGTKYFAIILDDFNQNRQNKGLVNVGKTETKLSVPSYDCSNGNPVPIIPTRANIYSLNQILQNRIISKTRNYGVNSSDVLAIIPINNNNINNNVYTIFGTDMIINERKYFGPVKISRFKIRIVDDKGITLNLNGADWNLSLITTELYQY